MYPTDPDQTDIAAAEKHGPWQTKSGTGVWFRRLALYPDDAARELAEFVGRIEPGEAEAAGGGVRSPRLRAPVIHAQEGASRVDGLTSSEPEF